MNISDFKAAHPDYADVPDLELADALHQKFYAEVPRADFLQKVGLADAGGDLSTGMPRDAYARRFMADNPQARPEALDAVLAQYDQQQVERTRAAGNAVQDKFKAMQSPEAMFNARLNERLQGERNGVVPQLPGRISPDMPHVQTPANRLREELAHELAVEQGRRVAPLPASNVNPQDYQDMLRAREGGPGTVLANAATGLWGTAMGVEATGAAMLGMEGTAAQLDAARAQAAEAARLNGGGTILGKASNLAGAIAPAMVSGGAGLIPELAGNAGLFGAPAARDAYREQKAKGASEAVAIEHAMAAMGINTALPMIAPGGSRAITKLLGQADAAGLKGAGIQLAQAAGEGAGFAVANSVSHKGIDAANGIQTDEPWVNLKELPSEALAFAALRGAHIAGHGVGSVAGAIQRAREQRALIADIGRASNVDEAIAAATRAVQAPAGDHVADILQQIRPLDKAPDVAAPQGRIEPVLGEPAVEGTPTELGRKYVRVQDADGSTRMAPDINQEIAHGIGEAAPAEGSDRGTGSATAVRPGETVGQRPETVGPVPERAPPLDLLPGEKGGADPVRAGAGQPDPALGDNWHAFPAESGTLGISRADMPQIAAHARGAMTQFLKARGIEHEQVEIPAEDLKPTQAEFSLNKVQKAHEYQGGERSILVSSDNHVLDGHHQWLASVEKGEPVKAIRLDAPIRDLLEQVKEFPSATVSEGAPQNAPQNIPKNIPDAQRPGQAKLDEAVQRQQKQDEAVRLAAENIAQRQSDKEAERAKLGAQRSSVKAEASAIVEIKDVYGRTHRVRQDDLTGEADRISTIRKNGEVVTGEEIPRSIIKVDPPAAPEPKQTANKSERAKIEAQRKGAKAEEPAEPVAAPPSDEQPIAAAIEPAAPATPKAADPLDGIPRTFLKKTNVEHQTYHAEAKRWETASVPADQALRSVRDDISNLEAMLKCMKG